MSRAMAGAQRWRQTDSGDVLERQSSSLQAHGAAHAMKKKRKSRKGSKNKGVSDEAKLIAELILDADGIRKRIVPLNPDSKKEEILGSAAALEEKLIMPALLRLATAADGSLAEVDRAIKKLRKQTRPGSPMTAFDKFVEDAYMNLRVPGECTFPTEDELCYEYCRLSKKERTDSIKTMVSRSARKQ